MSDVTVRRERIPESRGPGRLGRHIAHDEASRGFPARTATVLTTAHHRHYGVYDQGDLGSCTGNALCAALMTAPLHVTGRILREPDAVRIYSEATVLDGFDGTYPPSDNGSSVLAAAKAAKAEGLISEYRWTFSLADCLAALVLSPVMVGVNWYDGFDAPNPEGLVHVTGSIRGGHAFTLIGLDAKVETVFAVNSWGTGYGRHGRFCFSFADLSRLLAENGDAVVPVA